MRFGAMRWVWVGGAVLACALALLAGPACAPKSCTTNADCGAGAICQYRIGDCNATGECLGPPRPRSFLETEYCSCSGDHSVISGSGPGYQDGYASGPTLGTAYSADCMPADAQAPEPPGLDSGLVLTLPDSGCPAPSTGGPCCSCPTTYVGGTCMCSNNNTPFTVPECPDPGEFGACSFAGACIECSKGTGFLCQCEDGGAPDAAGPTWHCLANGYSCTGGLFVEAGTHD
jgi:hypothetical protein